MVTDHEIPRAAKTIVHGRIAGRAAAYRGISSPNANDISPNRIAEDRQQPAADHGGYVGSYFGNSSAFWLNLQTRYDHKMTRQGITRRLSICGSPILWRLARFINGIDHKSTSKAGGLPQY